ncbi:hypothetical protein LCGC14_0262630 [marine sediment metagenome]|uniref:Uncharacterized protein n=1 Tax=marine sediment metagenome TaxID=412755 RepID=A0A0F9U5W1_9ZZZZ
MENPGKHEAKLICAWCGAEMGSKKGFTEEGAVSHGICPKCKEKYFGNPYHPPNISVTEATPKDLALLYIKVTGRSPEYGRVRN